MRMIDVFKQKPVLHENISPSKFSLLMKDKEHIVLDVRTLDEFETYSIPKAKNIDYYGSSFKNKIELLDKTKSYLVYCRNGARARKTCSIMANIGFEKLYNLKGGIKAWKSIDN